jgi:peptidyl-prolyl cis-trans isomerase SurA
VNLRAFFVGGLMMAFVGGASPARAAVVERVVAVIGERPIFWTELQRRAAAARAEIWSQTLDPSVIVVQEQEMYKELLERMIDDRLEEQQADKAHVSVSSEEIDRGIGNIAASAQAEQGRAVSVADVFDEVRRRGMAVQDFRDEIRRQLLEGKLIELRIRPRVRVTEGDAHAAYERWVAAIQAQQPMTGRTTSVPPYGAVRDKMMERALLERLDRARNEWLRDLRRSAYVDVRL